MSTLGVVAATGGDTRWIELPDVRPNEDYIPRSGWLNPHTVWVETLNRDHRHLDIWFADSETGKATRALALTKQEPERRFLERRLRGLSS